MVRRAITKEHIRNIQRSGGSYHVSIPIRLMRDLGWRERQKVTVVQKGNKIVIEDWK